MSWGSGFGTPWGGPAALRPDNDAVEVGDDPFTFDFSDEADGPMPGLWEFYVLTTTAGVVTGDIEPDPVTYFRVKDGLGWFRYDKSPVIGDPFEERGFAASPSAVLTTRNARLAAIFETPTRLLDPSQDEFVLEVILGLRVQGAATSFVGARVRSEWAAGTWTTPVALEAVTVSDAAPVVVGSYFFDPDQFIELIDIWDTQPQAELEIVLRGTKLAVALNGVWEFEVVDVGGIGPAKPVIEIKAYNKFGVAITPVPSLAAFQLQTLRDFSNLGKTDGFTPERDVTAPTLDGHFRLPLADLVAQGFFKRVGGRVWEATEEVEVDVLGIKHTFNPGNRVVATEPVGSSVPNLVPVEFDLARIRGEKERG